MPKVGEVWVYQHVTNDPFGGPSPRYDSVMAVKDGFVLFQSSRPGVGTQIDHCSVHWFNIEAHLYKAAN